MLRFIKHNFDSIDGVAIYPIISMLLFILVFVVMLVIVMRFKKKYIEEISQLPLEDDDINLNNE